MKKYSSIALVCIMAIAPTMGSSSELVYTPINPSFGGSPLNGSYLLSNAQAQNKYKDPDLERSETSSIERLTSSLQSRLISQLLADVGDGNSGYLATDEFTIQIEEGPDGTLSILITDLITNETTFIEVNGLVPDT